ncbi:xylulokinase [Flaviflexus massiliensis]|uniref:xylulokinase n=1 Tax=Flaviflexus massiliensis TaxID=1522309 RepID=UPI0028FC902E|nr:FGGY-family carbohydrate kinase [Flaviflexus massiliensis]
MIRPFIGWQDTRGVGYVERIRNGEFIDPDRYYEISGYPVATVPCMTKYMWYKDNEPENWDRTVKLSHHQDFFLKEFGADDWYVNDTATASRTGIFDVEASEWSSEIIEATGLSGKELPRIVQPGTVVGKINRDISLLTGLAEGTLLTVGAMDQNCSTLGGGLIHEGTAVSVIGTYGAVYVAADDSVRDPNGTLIVKNNSGPENYTVEAASIASASAYRWFRDTLGPLEVAMAREFGTVGNPYHLINKQIDSVAPGANGLTFLPYMQGAGSGPRSDPYARGSFLGMTLGTTKPEIARAVMEGITLEMRDNLESIRKIGIEVKEIRAAGGATNSRVWNQMQADIYQVPVAVLEVSETGCLGAALYAGIGLGAYKDFDDAVNRAVRIKEVYEPIAENFEAYDKAYGRFVAGYEALSKGGFFKYLHEQNNS